MEIRHYLPILARRWKIVLLTTATAALVSVFFLSGELEVYESSGTYLVRPDSDDPGDNIRATEALNRGSQTTSTYARIARSDSVKAQAKDSLRADGISPSGLSAQSRVLPGTNVLEIGGRGSDPEAVLAYAIALGEQTTLYLDETTEIYALELLDAPDLPDKAVRSNDRLNLIVAAVLGFGTGCMLAFALEYFAEESSGPEMHITHTGTGAHTQAFFRFRLRQELSRCGVPADLAQIRDDADSVETRLASRSFSVCFVSLDTPERSENGTGPGAALVELRDAAAVLLAGLRDEDVCGYLGGTRFGVIMPDITLRHARKTLDEWTEQLTKLSTTGEPTRLVVAELALSLCDATGVRGTVEGDRIADEL